MSGVLVAPVYPFEMAQADGASSSGVCALLQADGGGSCRVRVHACPPDEAAQLRAGRRLCILHVWLTMGGDGWPCVRVDDAAAPAHLAADVVELEADAEKGQIAAAAAEERREERTD